MIPSCIFAETRMKRSRPQRARRGSLRSALRRYYRDGLAIPQILDVNVCAEPYVVREIPTVVIRVLIDHDLIGIPEPVIAETEIVRGDAKIEAAEPETARASSANPPDVAATETSGKPPVFPGMIQMIVDIIAPGIMADPSIMLDINVGNGGMTGTIGDAGFDRRRGMRWGFVSSRAVGGNVTAAYFGFVLCENRSRKQEA
jgi:hypothetical protein